MPDKTSDVVVLAVAVAGVLGAIVDLRTRRIPNSLVVALSVLGFLLAAGQGGGPGLAAAVAGFAIGFVLMLPGHVLGATGAGDVKLFAAMGALLGPVTIASAFLYTALAGGVLALLAAVRRRRLRATVERTAALVWTKGGNVAEIEHAAVDNRFAYAPAIAIGTFAASLGL